MVISPLGAIKNRTVQELSELLGVKNKSTLNLWAKKFAVAALKDSLEI
jgi:hypothetical protein